MALVPFSLPPTPVTRPWGTDVSTNNSHTLFMGFSLFQYVICTIYLVPYVFLCNKYKNLQLSDGVPSVFLQDL